MSKKGFSPEQEAYIKTNYGSLTALEMATELGCERYKVKNFVWRHKLAKGKNTGQFAKGFIPHNKGKKGVCAPGSEKGFFPKGNQPHNTKEDGAISIRQKKHPNGRIDPPYKYYRVSKGVWELYHRHIWKAAGREIPKGSILTFKNGDTLDCRIDNLELITKAANARRNHNPEKAMLHDNMMALHMTRNEPHLREEIKKHPELIALKRAQIIHNREIKKAENESTKAA